MEDVLSQSIIDDFSCKSSFRNKQCKPPKEAYLFFPEENDILLWDASFPNKTMRRIFEGAIEYNEFEKAILVEFKEEFFMFSKKMNQLIKIDTLLLLHLYSSHYFWITSSINFFYSDSSWYWS